MNLRPRMGSSVAPRREGIPASFHGLKPMATITLSLRDRVPSRSEAMIVAVGFLTHGKQPKRLRRGPTADPCLSIKFKGSTRKSVGETSHLTG